MSIIQKLFDACKEIFANGGTGFVPPPDDVKRLCSILDSLSPSDVGLHPDMSYFLPKINKQLPVITYMDLYKGDNFSMEIFCLPPSGVLPLHNHTGMTGFSKLLFGTMHIKSYDWADKKPGPFFSSSDSTASSYGNAPVQLARLKVDADFVAPCNTSIVFPDSGGNIHCITAVTACAVLDVLAPPYSDADGRPCRYYLEHPFNHFSAYGISVPENERETFAWLQERDRPDDLVFTAAMYRGPKIAVRSDISIATGNIKSTGRSFRRDRNVIKSLQGKLSDVTDEGFGSILQYDLVEILKLDDRLRAHFSDVDSQYHDRTGERNAVEKPVDLERVKKEYLDCLTYCNLFPKGYEIEGDDLLQLWIAVGLIEQEPMELFAATYLSIIRTLEEPCSRFISLTRVDCGNGEEWYKFQAPFPGLPTTNTKDQFHAWVGDQPLNLDSISSRFTQLRTLLLSNGQLSSEIDRLPSGFFPSLKLLQALDLSGTKLSELPSSVGCAKALRYINLSNTLIRRLPEAVCFLPDLQTLKLRNCTYLVELPQTMSRVTSLRHLDLGPRCDLCSMPPLMGALTWLYTLSNFIVGRNSGCGIGELKNLKNLKGRLSLSRLDNILSVEEAKEAQLEYKNIAKLELRWTDSLEWESEDFKGDDFQEQVIQHLQPPKGLRDLDIHFYGGSKFPTWISLPWFDKLANITLFKCENCQLLPSLGQLPALESLTLVELVQVKIIDSNFCYEMTTPHEDNLVAFPKLQRLEMESMLSLEEWREMGNIDYFPRLTRLVIKDCPNLTTLCRLSSVGCLEYLELNYCEKLPSLPEGGLPVSVKEIVIGDCSLLSSWCNNSLEEQGWRKRQRGSSLFTYHRATSLAPV